MRSLFTYIFCFATGLAAVRIPDLSKLVPWQTGTVQYLNYPSVPRLGKPKAFRLNRRGNCLGCSSGKTTSYGGGSEGSQAPLTRPASPNPLVPITNPTFRYRATSILDAPPERPLRWDEFPRPSKKKLFRAPSLPKSPPPPPPTE